MLKEELYMPKKINITEEIIKESVCQFYLDNKADCDLKYNDAENDNIENIYENVIETNTIHQMFAQVALVILTANKYEKNVLHHNVFIEQNEKIKKIEIALFPKKESKEVTYAYWFKWQGYVVLNIEAQVTGSYTVGGSADIVRYVLNNKYLYPLGIVSFGICFGTNENKYSLGDVVISKKVYPYFIGAKITETGYFVDDNNVFRIDSKLSADIRAAIDRNIFSRLKGRVYFGNYITGEAVVSRKKARDDFIKTTTQEVIAGDMEGYGLFKECKGAYCSIACLVVKAICDWAVMKNFSSEEIFKKLCNKDRMVSREEQRTLKDRIQAYASFQAFEVLDILLSKQIFEQSLMVKVVEYIEKFHAPAIYANHIKNKIKEIATAYNCDSNISDTFVMEIIWELIERKLIFSSENELDGRIDMSFDKIEKYAFLVERRK